MSRSFDKGDKEWWTYITREEWQFLYATTCAREMMEEAPLETDVDVAMRWLLYELQSHHGYDFSGVSMSGNGELTTTRDELVCKENLYFFLLLRQGIPPDLEVHLHAAIAFAEALPEFDISILRGALARAESHLEQVEQATRRRVRGMPEDEKRLHIEAILTRDKLAAGYLSLDGEETEH